MRILHSIVLDGWSAGSWYAVNIAHHLDRIGHENLFVCRPNCRTRDEAAAAGLRIFDQLNLESKHPLDMMHNLSGLRALLAQEKPDVICAHWGEDHAYWGLVKFLTGSHTPLVRVRSLDPKPPRAHPLSRWLHRRQTSLVIVTNAYLRDCYVKILGLPKQAVTIVPPGLDVTEFAGLSRLPDHYSGFKAEYPTVGLLARFSPVKGHRIFFQAASQVVDAVPGVRFIVAGFESELKATDIARLAEDAGVLDRTEIIARRTSPSPPIIVRFDVGTVSSIYSESVSRSLMECLAAGVPVVAAAVGGIPDLLAKGEFGVLVPARDPAALARGIVELLHDCQRRLRLGQAGREFIRTQRTWEKSAAQFARALEYVVKNNHGRSGSEFRAPEASGTKNPTTTNHA